MPLFPAPAYAPSAASALFISTQEAAELLHVSPWTIRTLVKRGDLHAFRPVIGGKKFLLYASEVQQYAALARATSPAAQDAAWEAYRKQCMRG